MSLVSSFRVGDQVWIVGVHESSSNGDEIKLFHGMLGHKNFLDWDVVMDNGDEMCASEEFMFQDKLQALNKAAWVVVDYRKKGIRCKFVRNN